LFILVYAQQSNTNKSTLPNKSTKTFHTRERCNTDIPPIDYPQILIINVVTNFLFIFQTFREQFLTPLPDVIPTSRPLTFSSPEKFSTLLGVGFIIMLNRFINTKKREGHYPFPELKNVCI
jgi:hypothetical protein